jgi:hypothetical protein
MGQRSVSLRDTRVPPVLYSRLMPYRHTQGKTVQIMRKMVRLDNLAQRLGYGAAIDALETPQSPMPLFPLSKTERRELGQPEREQQEANK